MTAKFSLEKLVRIVLNESKIWKKTFKPAIW